MKNLKILLILFLIVPSISFAQRGGKKGFGNYGAKKQTNYFKGKINGKVLSEDNLPLEFASVTLINKRWDKVIEGTITDSKGKYNFSQVRTGKYLIIFSYIGFINDSIEVELTKRKPDIKVDDRKLKVNSEVLSEVTITEEKPIYESKIDKIVYNVENDSQGSDDAVDVLRKAPLLSVDLDGNVELRGSSNIKFLLNGKTSTFLSGDMNSALSMIPADQIKSIEVITSPGAKYDGEGDAGIVNIVTKRKIIDGYKASVNGSFGNRNNRNSANLNVGKDRFSFSARANAWYSWPREGETSYIRDDWTITGDTNTLTNNGNSKSQWIGYNAGMGLFYNINAYNSISSDFSFGGRTNPSENSTTLDYDGIDTSYSYQTFVDNNNYNNKLEWNTDYTLLFDEEEKELNISYQIGARFKDNTSTIDEYYLIDTSTIRNLNEEINTENTFQIDYVQPIENHKLEVGGKIISRNQNMEYETKDLVNSSSIFDKEKFDYDQLVSSVYVSGIIDLTNDYSLLAGVRFENTNIKGSWLNNSYKSFENNYNNLLPNLTFSKSFGIGKSIKLSYNNRISRPSSRYVNPNTEYKDNKNLTIGNPDLTPSNTSQIELGYNSFGRKYQGSYFVYLKNSTDLIESILNVRNDTTFTEYQNIGNVFYYGFNYYGSLRFEKLTLRGGLNLYSYNAEDENFARVSRTAFLYNYNFGITVEIVNNWKFEGYGWMRSPSQTLQGSSTNFGMMSFGIKKDFKNKRGSLGIRVVDPFLKNGNKVFSNEVEGNNFYQYSESLVPFRSIGVSFNYTFGKLNFKIRSKSSKIRNDDVENDGDNNQF